MSESQSVRLHRVLRCPPARVFRAFTDPRGFARWLPPFGFTAEVHEMDVREGGTWRMSFHNFSSGHSHAFGGRYLEVVPDQRLRYTARFDTPDLPGEMTTAVTLTPVFCGTELEVVQSGIPPMIPLPACYLGWQESLVALAQLVEPEIPG